MRHASRLALVAVLAISFGTFGCSFAWVTTLDNILVAAAPALINILQIVAIAEGKPLNSTLAAKVNADAAAIKSVASDFATADAAAAPGVCSQLQADIGVYQSDITEVLSVAQVSDPATEQKILILSGLVTGTASAVLAVIPSCSAPPAALRAAFAKAPPLPLKSFVNSYNSELAKPTGNAAVDAYTKAHKIHVHSWARRVMSLGYSY